MDLNGIGLNEALARGAADAGFSGCAPFIDMTFRRLVRARRDVNAAVKLGDCRPAAYLVPAFEWLLGEGSGSRALVVVPSDKDIGPVGRVASSLATSCGVSVRTVGREPDDMDGGASLVIGALDTMLVRHESETFDLAAFGFVAVDGLDRITEPEYLPSAKVLRGSLRPASERRTVLFSSLVGPREREFAAELAADPEEIQLVAESERTRQVPQATWYVASDAKLKLALGILSRDTRKPVCVACNLADSADETVRRLAVNNVKAELLDPAAPERRKAAVVDRLKRGEFDALVVTDESLRGLPDGFCGLLLNYDLPLEGEHYVDRLRLVDKADGGIVNLACDRYVYGIPAIEQVMGMSLDAVQADEAAFAALDKSSGMAFDRKRADGRGRRELKPRPDGRPRDEAGDVDGNRLDADYGRARRDGPRQQAPRPRDGRGGRPERGGRSERGDRRRDADADLQRMNRIRSGIAEATGGSIDMVGGAFSPPRRERPAEERRERPEGGEGSNRGGRRKRGQRQGRAASERDIKPLSDPYAVSMEERMKLYREKYGKKAAQDEDKTEEDKKRRKRGRRGRRGGKGTDAVQQGENAQAEQPAGKREGGKSERKPEAKRDAGKPRAADEQKPEGASSGRGRRGGRRRRGGKGDGAPKSESGAPRQAPLAPAPEPKKGGLVGRILGIFGKKD